MRSSASLQTNSKHQETFDPVFKRVTSASSKSAVTGSYKSFPGMGHSFGNVKVNGSESSSSKPIRLHAKLKINQPGDEYEREADYLADKVMNIKEPFIKTKEQNKNKQRLPFVKNHQPDIKHPIGGGQPLSQQTRDFFEPRFGYDLSKVRTYTDDKAAQEAELLQASAFTSGNDIFFGKGNFAPHNSYGRKLLTHELAHVVNPSHKSIMRAVTPDYNQIEEALSYGLFDWVITDENAHDVLVILNGLNVVDLNDTLARMETDGFLNRLLENISSADLITYNTTVQRILQRIQRTGATKFAAGLGLSSQAAMAQEQANFMVAQNTAAAAAIHGSAPTPAQISAQQSASVASTSIAPQTAVLSPADETLQNAAATTAVATFITWVTANHPDLNITSSDIRVDSRAVFDRGLNIIAFAEAGQAVVGSSFTAAVNANPAYALPTIIHELRGHTQYGPYGAPGSEYGLELYDQAAALMPGYTQPSSAGRTSEIDAYAYQETEIYSLLLEVPYYTPNAPAHSTLASINFDPAPAVSSRIGIIKSQFESRVAQSLIRGLVLRFRSDPRLQPQSVAVFEQGVRDNFTPAEATAILQ